MKKKFVYTAIAVFFVAVLAVIFVKYNNDKKNSEPQDYGLLPRTGVTAEGRDWLTVKQQVFNIFNKLHANPKDTSLLNQLVILYIQESRITGNHVYYDKAALHYADRTLAISPNNFEALMLKALLYNSQHHFTDALTLAEKAKNINPYNSFVYGIITDAHVELGNYKDAVTNADKMTAFRPDIRSYSRVSYLREIYGDYPGAIAAMKMAVEAGTPGDETTEWTRVQMGHLYENIGDIENATAQYEIALSNRPGYAYALAGLARISSAAKNYDKAISYYMQADSQVIDLGIKEALADVYIAKGDMQKANALQKKLIEEMNKEAQSGNSDENIGHYVDKELAYAYLKLNDYDNAEKHALIEYQRRPDNNDVNECVAWIYYNMGKYDKALPYMQKAMQTGTKNPTTLCRAGLIFSKAGDKTVAKNSIQQALKNNPNIEEKLRMDSMQALQSL